MHRLWIRALLPVVTLAAAGWLAGCSDDSSPTGPAAALTQDDADGVAQQVAATLAADNGGTMALLAGSLPAGAKSGGGAAVAGADAETTFTLGGLTYTLTRTFYDAGGDEMAAFDPLLTARMVTAARAAGSIATDRFSATLGHASLLDVTGVSARRDTLRFNGAAHDTCLSSFTSLDGIRTRHFFLASSGVLEDVLLAKPVGAGSWPLSGTATWSVVADRLRSNDRLDVAAHLEATVVVTFNGTREARIEVDGHWTYRADLKTGALIRNPA